MTRYEYDDVGRQNRVTQEQAAGGTLNVDAKRVDMVYNAAGQLDLVTMYNDLAGTQVVATSDYQYNDPVGRLSGIVHTAGSLTPTYGYGYDAADRLTSWTTPDGVISNTFDAADQLLTLDYAAGGLGETHAYDGAGNRTLGYTTGKLNRLLEDVSYKYQYDKNGNVTKKTQKSDPTKTIEYVWDYRQRLTAVIYKTNSAVTKRVDYKYDANNYRIEKKVDLDGDGAGSATYDRYVLDGSEVLLRFDGSNAAKHLYLHGPSIDQVFADDLFGGDTAWGSADHQGSVRDLVNNASTSLGHVVFNSFGQKVGADTRAVDFLFGYTGREFDAETGLQYNRGRYYDPVVGRWLSEDPSRFTAGDANLYRYVGNNPLSNTDPSGLRQYNSQKPSSAPTGGTQSLQNLVSQQPAEEEGLMSWLAGKASAAVTRLDQLGGQVNTFVMTGGYWPSADVASAVGDARQVAAAVGGGVSIVTNEFSFGASDYVGLTNSDQYQGWEYDGSRIFAAIGKEAAIGALTGGSSAWARYGSKALDVIDFAESSYGVYTEAQNYANGGDVSWLNLGLSSLGVAGPAIRAGGQLFSRTDVSPDILIGSSPSSEFSRQLLSDIPVNRQPIGSSTCVPSSVDMLMDCYSPNRTHTAIGSYERYADGMSSGSIAELLSDNLEGTGYSMRRGGLEQAVSSGNPFMAIIDNGHDVVVDRVTTISNVPSALVKDPARGAYYLPLHELDARLVSNPHVPNPTLWGETAP